VNYTIPESLLTGLNEPQRQAVCFKDGPLIVLAGPGSGKTRVVTHRIAALIHQGVYPSRIVALTFTNKAAEEMKTRLQTLAPNCYVRIGTFHSFCAYLLRRYIDMVGLAPNFTIYDSEYSLNLIKGITDSISLPSGITPQKIADAVSKAKNQLIRADDYIASYHSLLGKVVEEVYPLYQKELLRANAVDFDDLLLHTAVLLKENPELRSGLDNRYRYVLVDEYQDTNLVQYFIAKALCIDHQNLAVTGDPDQSIYGWRGADIRNILDFEKDYPDATVIRLEQNYRSTPQILDVADVLIQNNTQRKDKRLTTDNPSGKPVRLVQYENQYGEADNIAREIAREVRSGKYKPSDYAVFYRMNALSRNLEHALRREQVPFQLVRGLEFFNRKEVKDILAYLRVVANPADTVSLSRIINEPTRGIGKTTLKKLSVRASSDGTTIFEQIQNIDRFNGIAAKTKKGIKTFASIVGKISEAAAQDYTVESLISMVMDESGYRNMLLQSNSEEDMERLANIEELLTEAREFDNRLPTADNDDLLSRQASGLEEFLEQAALISDVDGLATETDRVALMTLHAAKGLEFPVVYIIAIEEGILPHSRSTDSVSQTEEERRLFFVGITRAERELRLSHVNIREFRGLMNIAISSSFLFELPGKPSLIKLDSPEDIEETIDREDGTYIVLEKFVEKIDELIEPPEYEPVVEYDNEYADIEYDDDGKPVLPNSAKQKKKNKKSSKSSAEIITASELAKRK